MITALQLRNGTKFSASNVAGIYRKIRNEGNDIIATQIFGESIEKVGKETTIDGSTPCFILGNESNRVGQSRDNSRGPQNRRARQQHNTSGSPSVNQCTFVSKDEEIIYSCQKPSAAFISAVSQTDCIRIDGNRYDIAETAFDIDQQALYVTVD